MQLCISAIISQLFKVISLAKWVLTILDLNWNNRFRNETTKPNICHHNLTSSTQPQNRSFHIVERTRMCKNEKCTCQACKIIVLLYCQICKFVTFLLPSSSWLLKLLIISSWWKFDPYQLVRYQILVFHFPTNKQPQFAPKLTFRSWEKATTTRGKFNLVGILII